MYRSKAEVQDYRKKDPISRFRQYLTKTNNTDIEELNLVDEEIKGEIAEAVAFARESPEPDPSTAMDYIYA